MRINQITALVVLPAAIASWHWAAAARAEVTDRGSFATSVQLKVPAFRGLEPVVSLSYESAAGNGLLGVGWRLTAGSYVTRAGAHGGTPRFDDSDIFQIDGEELIRCTPACPSGGTHETRDRDFTRISFQDGGWTRWRPDGVRFVYEPLPVPGAGGISRWALTRVVDTHGQTVTYSYACDGGDCYATLISYADGEGECDPDAGPCTTEGARIRFHYESRPDPVSYATGGSLAVIAKRLRSVEIRMAGELARAYALEYDQSSNTAGSILRTIQAYPADAGVSASGAVTTGATTPQPATTLKTASSGGPPPSVIPKTLPMGDELSIGPLPPGTPAHPPLFRDEAVAIPGGFSMDGEYGERLPYGSAQGDFDRDGRTDMVLWGLDQGCSMIDFTTLLASQPKQPIKSTEKLGPYASMDYLCESGIFSGGDFDGDRRDDLLLRDTHDHLRLMTSRGDGTFALRAFPEPTPLHLLERCISGDLDDDQRDDLACLYDKGGVATLGVVGLKPSGFVTKETSLAGTGIAKAGRVEAAIGDTNADGIEELLLAARRNVTTPSGNEVRWELLVGTADGAGGVASWHFRWNNWSDPKYDADKSAAWQLLAGDVDGDGRADMALVRNDTGLVRIATSPKGGWAAPSASITVPTGHIILSDVNGDARADLQIMRPSGALHQALATGDGHFSAAAEVSTGEPCFEGYDPTDVNGDGNSDWLCATNVDADGNGGAPFKFRERISPNAAMERFRTLVGDPNADGLQDVLYVHPRNPGYEIYTWRAKRTGGYTKLPPQTIGAATELAAVSAGAGGWMAIDVGGGAQNRADGKTDLVLADRHGVYTLLSTGDGWTAKKAPLPWGSSDFQQWMPGAIEPDGRTDLVQFSALGAGVRMERLRSKGDGTWTYDDASYFTTAEQQGSDFIPPLVTEHAPRFLSHDVNADGFGDYSYVEPGTTTRIRTLLGRGDGTWLPRTVVVPQATSRAGARAMEPMDFNADGAGDIGLARPNGNCLALRVFVSTGSGWTPDAANTPAPSACAAAHGVADTNNIRLADVNGDNLTDVMHVSYFVEAPDRPDAGTPKTAVHVLLNRAGGTWEVIDRTAPFGFLDTWSYRALDIDMDGSAELVRLGASDVATLDWTGRPDLLTESSNGQGATTHIDYRALDGARRYLPSGSLPTVVDTVKVTDAAHSPAVESEVRWSYGGATWSDERNRLLGFESKTSTERGTVQSVAYELTESCGARASGSATKTALGDVLSKTATTFVPSGAAPPFTCLPERTEAEQCEGKAACMLKRTVFAHDAYGNVTETLELGAKAGARRTVVDYRPNLKDHIVDRAARKRTYGTETPTMQPKPEDWRLSAMTEFVYDANATWDEAPGPRAELRQERAWDDNRQTFATTTRTYDARGNEIEVTNAVGVTQSTVYDPGRGLFPEQHCNLVGCTTQTWDETLGVVTATEDVNGEVTVHGHDAFGRLTSTVRPGGGGMTRVRYLDEGSWTGPPSQRRRVRTEVTDGSKNGVLWEEQLLDGLDRTYMTIKEGAGSQAIVSETLFADTSERAAAVSSAHVAGTPAVWTRYEYDAAHRPKLTTFPDGSLAMTEHPEPGETLTTDPVGRRQRRVMDEFGRVVRIDELAGHPDDEATTTYRYNALDLPELVVDDLGNETRTTYDSLGRRITEHAPDRGLRTWAWRADGTPASARDARDQEIVWEYDNAGRTVRRRERAGDGTVLRTVRWHWDRDPKTGLTQGHSIGHVVRSEHSSPVVAGSNEAWYDALGRAVRSRGCVDGKCAEMRSEFDAAGRLSALEYPAPVAERVAYAYDEAGRLKTVWRPADKHLYAKLSHTALGQLDSLQHGNGLVERFAYDPARHWLDRHTIGLEPQTQPPAPYVYQAHYQHYRDAKLMVSTEHNPSYLLQRYFYDDHGRLVEVSSNEPDRKRDYDYDTIGRMTTNSAAGAYAYDDPDQVHAATATDGGHTRAHDANGNLTELHDPTPRNPGASAAPPDWNLSLEWTVGGMPERIEVNPGSKVADHVDLGYDADEQRVYKADSGGATRYFDRYLEQRPDGELTKFYWAGDRLIAKRDDKGVTSIHQDRKGSTRLLTDHAATVTQRFEYDPYGKPLSPVDGDERLWAGSRRDYDTGLMNMSARSYDYELGQFISADSLVPDLYSPQSLNRYSLTEDDPVNYEDRLGHMKMQVEQRKAQASESPFAAMYNRMISAECSGVFGVSCVRATPGAFYEERSGRLKTKQGDKVISDTAHVIKSWSGGVGADGEGPGPQYVEGKLDSGVVVRRAGASDAAAAPQAPTGTVTVEEGYPAGIHTPHGVVPTDENGTPYPETREQWLWLQCHGEPACTLAKAVDWQGVGNVIEIVGIQQLTSPLALLRLGGAGVVLKPGPTGRAAALHTLRVSAQARNGTTIAITGGAKVSDDAIELVTSGTVNTTTLQRAAIQGAEAALERANTWMHAEPKGYYYMKAAGYTPKWVESSRAFCPRCLQWLHDTGAVVTSDYTAFWP